MAINIPNSVFNVYYDVCDWLLSNEHTSYTCTLIYPPLKEPCSCGQTPINEGSTNVYSHGGPAPFNFSLCPLCGGNGYKETVNTQSIRLRIYWAQRNWIKIAGAVGIEDATAQIIGNLSDLQSILKADQIEVVDNQSQTRFKMTLAGEPFLHGFGKNKYFVAYLKRL